MREASFYDALYGNIHLKEKNIFPSLCNGGANTSVLRELLPKYHGLANITDRAGQSGILCHLTYGLQYFVISKIKF